MDQREESLTKDFYATSLKTQKLARSQILAYQRKLLEKLVRHARTNVPFYASGRLAPLFNKSDEVDWSRWREIEPLSRQSARDHEDELLARSVPQEMLPLETDMTSGSTGTPLKIRRSMLSRVISRALLARAIQWHDKHAPGRIALVRHMKDQISTLRSGGTYIIPSHLPSPEQLRMLAEIKPTHLVSYPNILAGWLEHGDMAPFADLRVAIMTGEQLSLELRERIARKFTGRIVNSYATTETGPIAYEDASGTLRVCEENLFLENGAEAAGAARAALITPFYSYAMPLIRYSPGDFIVFDESPSVSDEALRPLQSVIGRSRNLLRSPSGFMFFASISAKQLAPILDYRDWQIEQMSATEAEFRVVCAAPPTPDQKRRLIEEVESVLHGLKVSILEVSAIPRHPGKTFESAFRNPRVDDPNGRF